MTKEQALKVVKDNPDALDLTKPSHFGDLSPLVEVHVEIVTITRGECVKQDGGFMPDNSVITRLGLAAGVQFLPLPKDYDRLPGPVWVGYAACAQLGPDGSLETAATGLYEWDPEIQTEALRVKGKKGQWVDDGGGRGHYGPSTPYTPQELAEKKLDFMKFGLQRANTGSRTRAFLAALGTKRSFKDLFSDKGRPEDERKILVSRIIRNTKNEMVLKAQLDSMVGNIAGMYGKPAAAQLTAEAGMRTVGPGTEDHAAPSPASPGSFEPDPEQPLDPIALKKRTIVDLLRKYGDKLKAKTVEDTLAWIEGDQLNMISENDLDGTLAGIKKALAAQSVTLGGEA